MEPKKPSILVIDDNPMMLRLASKLLRSADFSILQAESGAAGISMAHKHLPSLILCDIMMPDMDGFDVLRAIRNHEDTVLTPFVFLTAHETEDLRRKGMELGADDFLHKPIERTELIVAVHSQLEKHAKQRSALDAERNALHAAQRHLMTMVAHELRTPLSSIKLAHQILDQHRESLAPERAQKFMNAIGAGVDRLSRIIEQMVLITQIEMGILTHQTIVNEGAPVSIDDMLHKSLDLAQTFTSSHTEVQWQSAPNGIMIRCDPNALRYALAELISNALRFSPADTPIEISAWHADEFAFTKIVDHGAGIPPEAIKDAFKPFSQIDREKHEQQGMGMGLSLARQIIEVHGGSLELQAGSGGGTEVVVAIPLVSNQHEYYF